MPNNALFFFWRHFEESQYENHRVDVLRKRKINAVPTVFSVPPPKICHTPRKLSYKVILFKYVNFLLLTAHIIFQVVNTQDALIVNSPKGPNGKKDKEYIFCRCIALKNVY